MHMVLKKSSYTIVTPHPYNCASFPFRPDLRQRRDVSGVANSTFLHMLPGESNNSAPEPHVQDFHERKVNETTAEIHGLQPFTVYRIDLHACNREIHQCSAPAFALARTEPAGEMTIYTHCNSCLHLCLFSQEKWIRHV